jgi:hypothetical protein
MSAKTAKRLTVHDLPQDDDRVGIIAPNRAAWQSRNGIGGVSSAKAKSDWEKYLKLRKL